VEGYFKRDHPESAKGNRNGRSKIIFPEGDEGTGEKKQSGGVCWYASVGSLKTIRGEKVPILSTKNQRKKAGE